MGKVIEVMRRLSASDWFWLGLLLGLVFVDGVIFLRGCWLTIKEALDEIDLWIR